MGQLCFEAEAYGEAVEDWLSAVDCFLLATAPKRAEYILAILHRLETDGSIPGERLDLVAALRVREQALHELKLHTRSPSTVLPFSDSTIP